MHAVVVRFTITDRSALEADIADVVREVSAEPGFVAVYGVGLEGNQGISILVFDSEVSAGLEALAAQVMERTALTVVSAEVGTVIGHA